MSFSLAYYWQFKRDLALRVEKRFARERGEFVDTQAGSGEGVENGLGAGGCGVREESVELGGGEEFDVLFHGSYGDN